MIKSESIVKVAAALVKAQAEMPFVKFDKVNPYYNSKYASLGAVIEAAKPILAKHGLSVAQMTVTDDFGEACGIETYLFHESGEFIGSRSMVKVPDSKNAVQEMGKIYTYIRRYSFASICGLYSDEDTDGNDAEGGKKEGAGDSKEKKVERPYEPEKLVEALKKMTRFVKPASTKQVEFLAMLLSQETVTDEERHNLQNFIFGVESLTKADKLLINAAIKWLDPVNDGGVYHISEMAAQELASVLEHIA